MDEKSRLLPLLYPEHSRGGQAAAAEVGDGSSAISSSSSSGKTKGSPPGPAVTTMKRMQHTNPRRSASVTGAVCLAIITTVLATATLLLLLLARPHHAHPLGAPEPSSAGQQAHVAASAAPAAAVPDALVLLPRRGGANKAPTTPITSAPITSTATGAAVGTSAASTVLVNYQVHQPVLTPHGATTDSGKTSGAAGKVTDSCDVVLMQHVFAFSYGKPFNGSYTPPDCKFNRVYMNFTVTSQGRQFDRLAIMYLNDTEVWRTSTAQPTRPPGIRWTYLKDMTEYLSLWQSNQKIIFDLGNLISDIYTGQFNTTLTATFFYQEEEEEDGGHGLATAPPADLIIPISKHRSLSDGASRFSLPEDNATRTIASFPRNAKRAVFSVSANGQADEEFWWSNVPQSDVLTFNATSGPFTGYGPWREVQVYIDGHLAGVDWPFPVVFTGGVVPSLHRPIAGPEAFDLREHEIDITAWLGVLCDGHKHTFSIRVAGLIDDGGTGANITETVGSSWYVTGKIFVWLDDDEGSVTTGNAPTVDAPKPSIAVSRVLTALRNGTNDTLTYDTFVSRSFSVSAEVTSQNSSATVTWAQNLSYSNKGYIWDKGFAQLNDFLTTGSDEATSSSAVQVGANYKTEYEYPLWSNSTSSYSAQGNLTIFGHLIQGQNVYVEGAAVYPDGLEAFSVDGQRYTGSLVTNSKDGTAYYFRSGNSSSGFGSTKEVFTFGGFTGSAGGSVDDRPDEVLYSRHVEAVNSTITIDDEMLSGNRTGAAAQIKIAVDSALDPNCVYAAAPKNGGFGAPRLFMNRHGVKVKH